ncbi:hypothetical protein [Mycobacterium sp. DBP42]|uniref:hypothetical protein n=1 Tax=Mycobacterium sp. DBP42 TaxID=2545267 RepID=UPI00110CEF50|nr:hypothetical protein [Mycobacterium sp. DBP42]TMS46531.1 hypothetical protein E0T84_29760 [Mycobacterium sp. DBP42]
MPGILPYQRPWLRADVVAGLAAGAVIIPSPAVCAAPTNPRSMPTASVGQRRCRTVEFVLPVRCTGLRDGLHRMAKRWPWWQEVESQGRYG